MNAYQAYLSTDIMESYKDMFSLNTKPSTQTRKPLQEAVGLQKGKLNLERVSRLEIIDENGRAYVNTSIQELSWDLQDGNKTLKLFIG